MALRNVLILRKPRSGCLEGRMALIQRPANSFTRSFAGVTSGVRSHNSPEETMQ
jgi:hypothetical protein